MFYFVFVYLWFRPEKEEYNVYLKFLNMRTLLLFTVLIFLPLMLINIMFLSSLPYIHMVFLCYRNIYDVLDVKYVSILLMILRMLIALLLFLVIIVLIFFFYKRNLIIHFHYFLMDKSIIFGLIPAALLILALIVTIPLSPFIDLYNSSSNLVVYSEEIPGIYYYGVNTHIHLNKILLEYEFCNNQSLKYPFMNMPAPSFYGAFLPLGLFIVIISSLIMFLGNLYRENKHFETYLREYIGRYVNKIITMLRPIHRIFIAGYGMLGKKLTYTILQHQLVNPGMLGLPSKVRYYDLILVPFSDVGELLKYEVAINNLCVITLDSEDLAINIEHPVLGKIGLMDVHYGAGERVFVPIILNDVSIGSILRYIKLVEPPPQRSFGYPVYIFLLIPVDQARSKAMYKLLDKTINNDETNQILLSVRARKSAEIIRIDARILDGRLSFLYPEYLMGYMIGRETL